MVPGSITISCDREFNPSLIQPDLAKHMNSGALIIIFYAEVSEKVFDEAVAREVSIMEFIEKQKES